jgi:hypothetical protein
MTEWDSPDWLFNDQRDLETADNLPTSKAHTRRGAQRVFINGLKKEALSQLVPTMPPPNTDVYVIGNGAGAEKKWIAGGIDNTAFDFGTFIPHLTSLFDQPTGCTAYISSWTMNRNHALSLIEMLDDGRLTKLTVFTDPYFQRREPAVATTLIQGLQRHQQTYLAFKNHCKIIALASGEQTCVVTGSANLSAQPRCEQYVLTTAPAVYGFFVQEFFEAMLNG